MASTKEQAVLAAFQEHGTYQATADALKKSRGYVHSIVAKYDQLKNREIRAARRQEKEAAAAAFLAEHLETTVQSDALTFLKALPDNSVQLHVTSPPYNISKSYDGSDDAMAHVAYLGWQVQLIAELQRTLRPSGTIVYQVGTTLNQDGERVPIDILLDQYFRMAKLTFQSRIMWPGYGSPEPKSHLKPAYETALVFSKGEPLFNPNAIREPQLHPDKRHFKGPHKGELSGHALGAFPTDIWKINRVGHNNTEKTTHPAQYPIEFPLRAILAYTLPGNLVCDIFSGSGSTQIAAVRAGRSFVGSDLGYRDVRAKRLATELMAPVSPLRGVTKDSLRIRLDDAKRRGVKLGILDALAIAEHYTDAEDRELCLNLGLSA